MKVRTRRERIATLGHRPHTVHVFATTVSGEPVARVEWREGRPARRVTKTFWGLKREREAQAKAYARGVHARLSGALEAPVTPPTVGALWELYVKARAGSWRPKTARLAVSRWRKFVLFVDPQLRADRVSQALLDEWRVALLATGGRHGTPMARNQIAHHVQLVKSVWAQAKQRRILADNPLLDYTVRRGKDDRAQTVAEYSPAEWAAILSALDNRRHDQWRAWCLFALIGMLAPRNNAARELTWADVDLTPGRRRITWPSATDKLGVTRSQPLPRDAVLVLRIIRVWHRREGYTGPLLFPGAQARTVHKAWTYQGAQQALHGACARAGVPRKPFRALHGLRRMRGKSILEATGDIDAVGRFLGDRDIRTLRASYLHEREGDLAHVLATVGLPERAPTVGSSGDGTATAPREGRAADSHL
jgi:hypothetical protein